MDVAQIVVENRHCPMGFVIHMQMSVFDTLFNDIKVLRHVTNFHKSKEQYLKLFCFLSNETGTTKVESGGSSGGEPGRVIQNTKARVYKVVLGHTPLGKC